MATCKVAQAGTVLVVFEFQKLEALNKQNPDVSIKLMRVLASAAISKLQRMVMQKDPLGEHVNEPMSVDKVIPNHATWHHATLQRATYNAQHAISRDGHSRGTSDVLRVLWGTQRPQAIRGRRTCGFTQVYDLLSILYDAGPECFEGLSDDDLHCLCEHLLIVKIPKETYILEAGRRATHMALLVTVGLLCLTIRLSTREHAGDCAHSGTCAVPH